MSISNKEMDKGEWEGGGKCTLSKLKALSLDVFPAAPIAGSQSCDLSHGLHRLTPQPSPGSPNAW